MQPIHLAIGLIEGLITSAVLLFVYEARPELLMDVNYKSSGKCSVTTTLVILAVVVAVVVAAVAAKAAAAEADAEVVNEHVRQSVSRHHLW